MGYSRFDVNLRTARLSLLSDQARLIAGVTWVAVTFTYALLAWRQVTYGLEYDESYNLTVVRNLAEGRGYASSGAFFPGSAPKAFDPLISTGPTVLGPAAVAWFLSNGNLVAVRAVPLAFFALYLVAATSLGRAAFGRWGAVLAFSAPLLLTLGVPDLTTRSLVPGRVIGEIVACALIMASAAMVAKGRLVAAAALAGLSIQAKFVFVVPTGVLLLGSALWFYRRGPAMTLRTFISVLAAAVAPTCAFELFRLVLLGPTGYAASLGEYVAFLQGQSGGQRELSRRAIDVLGLVTPGGWFLVLVALGAAVLFIPNRSKSWGGHAVAATGPRTVALTVLSGVASGSVWLFVSGQPSVRQALPAVLLVLPLLVASLAGTTPPSVQRLFQRRPATTALLLILLGGVLAQRATTIVSDLSGQELRTEQAAAAHAIQESGATNITVRGWWQAPEFQILTGLPPTRVGAPGVAVPTSIEAGYTTGVADARVLAQICGPRGHIYASVAAVVCKP